MSNPQVQTKRAVCSACLRAQRTCICDLVLPVAHATEVLILQHPLEVYETKGTARLLHLCLPNSRIVVGEQFDAAALHALLHEPWSYPQDEIQNDASVQPVLLYPQETGAVEAQARDTTERCRLIILDGTWRKSRKMLYLNPLLGTLPRVSLADPAPSRYQIRKAQRPQQLSTLEAACHALMRLEGNTERFEQLLHAFTEFVARQMHFAHTARNKNEAS